MLIKPMTGTVPCVAVEVQRNMVLGYLNIPDVVNHFYLVA